MNEKILITITESIKLSNGRAELEFMPIGNVLFNFVDNNSLVGGLPFVFDDNNPPISINPVKNVITVLDGANRDGYALYEYVRFSKIESNKIFDKMLEEGSQKLHDTTHREIFRLMTENETESSVLFPEVANIIWFPFPPTSSALFCLENATGYLVTLKGADGFREVKVAHFFVGTDRWCFLNDNGSGTPVTNYGYKVVAYARYPSAYRKNT